MRRERAMDAVVATALVPLALLVAIPFRRTALAATPLVSLGWDAALHATEGLDLFDDLRLVRPLDALALLSSRHWWGPVWAVASAPFQAAFGPSLAAASLPSLFAYVLTPSAAYLLVRRLSGGGLLAAAAAALFVGALFFRSPMLLETSAWPMLESLGGFLALLAWLHFARRGDRRERRVAFLAGAALFLLKYHFGLFALGTFAAVVLSEEPSEGRRRLAEAARSVLFRGAGAGLLAVAFLLAVLRLIVPSVRGDSLRGIPSLPNIAWGTFVFVIVLLATRRREVAPAWHGASGAFRDLVLFGLLPPALWCLDPANVRGFYRQLFQPTEAPQWNPVGKLVSFGRFLRDDWALGLLPAGLVLLGLALALVLPDGRTRRALAAFAVWPVLLMSLNTYPVEPRFLASLAPSLFAASVAGLLSAVARMREGVRGPVPAAVALLLVLGVGLQGDRWRTEVAARAPYCFTYDAAGAGAVEAALAAAAVTGPVRLRLPPEPPVWPTVRLALRLARRDLAPTDVEVSAEGP